MKKQTFTLIMALLMALALLAGCGQASPSPTVAASPAAETPDAAEAPAAEAAEAPASSQVAGAADMTTVEDVLEDGMVPVYAESLKEGIYPVEMKSSSSMFKADHCELVVKDGKLEAVLYMSSDSYRYMFAGTAEQAAAADPSAYISLEEHADAPHSFTLPIEALDAGVPCAAFSVKKELWYDRTLLFRADSLPLEAFDASMFTTAESLGLADGSYTVEVTLSGGSGKASIQSPALLTVQDGAVTAQIIWGSSHYDYMKIDDTQYFPVNTEGSSTFEVPVSIFDRPVPVIADTTAMSQPYEIAYSLLFDSSSIEAAP